MRKDDKWLRIDDCHMLVSVHKSHYKEDSLLDNTFVYKDVVDNYECVSISSRK